MSNDKIEISQGIPVVHWIFDGAPSQFGVQLSNKKIVPLKKVEWSFFHDLWLKRSDGNSDGEDQFFIMKATTVSSLLAEVLPKSK